MALPSQPLLYTDNHAVLEQPSEPPALQQGSTDTSSANRRSAAVWNAVGALLSNSVVLIIISVVYSCRAASAPVGLDPVAFGWSAATTATVITGFSMPIAALYLVHAVSIVRGPPRACPSSGRAPAGPLGAGRRRLWWATLTACLATMVFETLSWTIPLVSGSRDWFLGTPGILTPGAGMAAWLLIALLGPGVRPCRQSRAM